jgi:glucose/arabinose dehydrogenase
MFAAEYKNNIFIAEHGSWNRTKKIGYNVTRVELGPAGNVLKTEVFMGGMLQGNDFWGRPVDVLVMPDGALLVSDDWTASSTASAIKRFEPDRSTKVLRQLPQQVTVHPRARAAFERFKPWVSAG